MEKWIMWLIIIIGFFIGTAGVYLTNWIAIIVGLVIIIVGKLILK